jgi:hypothetical protein
VALTRRFGKSWALALFLVLASFALAMGASEKGEQLRRTMAEVALLNSQMAQRKDDAASTREKLSIKLGKLKREASQIIGKNKIETRADALEHPRVYYNLLLMAELEAYIDRYTERIAYYRVACDRLSYLYQQADDDFKIANTLSDLKIDALVGQTEKILDGYLPDAQTLVINPSTLSIASPDDVLDTLAWVNK